MYHFHRPNSDGSRPCLVYTSNIAWYSKDTDLTWRHREVVLQI